MYRRLPRCAELCIYAIGERSNLKKRRLLRVTWADDVFNAQLNKDNLADEISVGLKECVDSCKLKSNTFEPLNAVYAGKYATTRKAPTPLRCLR